ncbi:hypothetical protein BJ508DRAFT_331186 [Ascobolus immersus RN42]|uniref:Ty3 transposon capsid-like protein domain-containing protein n=1 Tax=Ascobolus immersus RN42 TaxID=1160509 RepID=A0A3N4HSZ8_ASCIM|nr:hypothetical protein BJ508DRAFT_331186 [Ascobolus immersus RN42]
MAKSASDHHSDPLSSIAEEDSPGAAASSTSTSQPLHTVTSTKTEKIAKSENPRRESLLAFNTEDGGSVPWACENFSLDLNEKISITTVGAHDDLILAVGSNNEQLHDKLLAWEEEQLEAGNSWVNLGTAVNWKFEELRVRAICCKEAYEQLRHTSNSDYTELQQLRQIVREQQASRDAADMEIGTLLSANKDLQQQLERLKTQAPFDRRPTPPLDPTVIDITVPKQYRHQLLHDSELKAYEGGSDLDTVFKFLKAIDYHIDTLELVFNEEQRIEYTISYLRGEPRRLAKEWRRRGNEAPKTWADFMRLFKARWIPGNAPVQLVSRLEKMDLKRGSVDTFNDEYRRILQLLGISSPRQCGESDQYYKIYHAKIKDATVRQTILHYSVQLPFGLNLEQLMEYTSKLMMALPKPQDLSTKLRPDGKTKKAYSVHVNNVEDQPVATASTNHTVNAVAASTHRASATSNTNSSTGPRQCYACQSTEHLLAGCPDRKRFWEDVNRKRAEAEATASAGKD